MKLSALPRGIGKRKMKRVGRGVGSKKGKTCGRGTKGDKSRSGYKRRYGKEGGQLPLFKKLPHRGFSRARFQKKSFALNLDRLEQHFEDGEVINKETLMKKGFPLRRAVAGLKVLGKGVITKKVVVEAKSFSKKAIQKLEEKGVEFRRI